MSSQTPGEAPVAAAAMPSTSSADITADTTNHQSVHAQLEALRSAPLDEATSDGASSDSSTSATSPAYTPLSLAMAGHVLGAPGPEPATANPVPSLDAGASLSPPQLYSSPALPADSKDLAHPVLIAPSHDANRNKTSPASTSPGLLSTQDPSSSSASVSPSAVSGSSTPARSAVSELHIYAQQIQQQLLNQHMHQQLAAGRLNLPSGSSPPRAGAPTSQVASTSTSTYNSPPDSGRTSPNLFGSTRSRRTPHVLETNRLDIQTHTSGRRMVNQYLIEGELGRGVHGKVRLARDLETGERVAVKIVEREARKRLGAGLGLLNRNHRTKDQSRLSAADLDAPTLSAHPSNSEAQDADRGTDSPQDDASGSASTTVQGVPATPSTQFAPLPHVPKSPSASAFSLSRRQPSDRDVERRREKEREKARKALLWTTDQKVRREIAIMKKCSHDNVVQLKEVIDDPQSKKIFMVLEHMEGGEVVWKDDQGHPTLTVDEARRVLRDVVCGLEYLHYQGIIHRDIKPANLLWDKDHRVKISDFGVSHFSYAMMIANDHAAAASASASSASDPSLTDDRELAKTAGSPAFFAPELCMSSFSSASPSIDPSKTATATSLADSADAKVATPPARPKVTKAIDVWALGITLYCLLFGSTPFTAESEYALFAVIPSTDYSIPTFMGADRVRVGPRKPRWQSRSQWTDEEADAQPASPSELCPDADLASLSDDAKQLRDLLDRLLEKDPAKRITLEDVKKHPWVTRGLQDAPAWLSETDPQHMPFVEISHADVEDALTGFSKLKQRVKRWQSKLLDSFAGGRRRSKSINNSSAASSVHADMRSDSGTSSPHPGRAVGTKKADSMPVTPFDSSSQSAPSTSSVRTPRTPLKGHIFFTRQKSAGSVGRRDGVSALRALTAAHRDELDSIASDPPQIKDNHTPIPPIAHQTVSPPQTSPHAFRECETEAPDQATNLSPMLPPPVLVDGADNGAMGPPTLASHRRASAQSTSSSGLRPDVGPEIPQRTSSDTHGAARRVSATSASPSLHTSSPRMPSLHRSTSRQDSTGNDPHPQRAASPRRSVDSEGRSSTLSISQASRVSGRHRLGDFLRGNWLMNGADDRNRSTSRPSTRGSRDAPPFPSTLGGASLSKRSGSVGSTASSVRPGLASSVHPLGPLSVDTHGAIQQAGARPESGTPTSAPVLGSTNSGGFAGAPSLSTELLAEPSESASLARSAFSALSQPSSPLTGSDAVGPFAFDHFGRRRHFDTPLEVAEYENDDVDLELELELSDDDLSDDLHGAHSANRGPMLINSGNGWTVRDGDEQSQHIDQSGFLPEAHVRKESSGSVSSNDILTPSVEGGYNVFKPPYQHILSPLGSSGMPDDTVAPDPNIAADEIAAPDCQTFAMGASLSSEADALRKANLTELGVGQAAVSDPLGSTRLEAEPTPSSSASVSRSASHLQHGSNESSRAPSAAETQATRSDVGGVQPEGKDLKAKDGTAATEESQFADAEEETAAQDGLDSISAKHALLSGSGATLGLEEEDDSDDQAVSFQARRKRSTRFRTPHPVNGQV